MRIAIGSDHAGFNLKTTLIKCLQSDGYEMVDCGTSSLDPVDYPDIALAVADTVLQESIPGILVCGTGVGISIAANKVPGIRAAVCQDLYTTRLARQHNDANIAAIGSRITAPELALEIVRTFLKTDFEAGRHIFRIEKISQIEKKCRERS
ncbi:MAG TPA: ribose 5-phosphate isomerase B [Syntrophomonadaceae bacterium]|nr:ribose 5-phosphate isomerase B [Syntrophomonadaceae bacterium]